MKSIPANNNGTKPPGLVNILPDRDVDDLTYFFRSYESAIGMRSQHEAFVAFVTQTTGSAAEFHDPYVEIFADIRRGNSVYHVLVEMMARGDSQHVTVLHLLYGEPMPNAPYEAVGRELAPLAHLTDAVEAVRLEIARKLANERTNALHHAASIRRGADKEVLSSTALTVGLTRGQDSFVSVVRSEARQLGIDACRAYLDAKEEVLRACA